LSIRKYCQLFMHESFRF